MKSFIILSILAILNTGCAKDFSDQRPYTPPGYTGDGLEVGTLSEVHIDKQLILKATDRIQKGKHKEVHSMLIYKDDMLVFEEYFTGHNYKWDAPGYHGDIVNWDREKPHRIMSCTKSFTSACIGIAVDLGYIESVNQSIFEYLPDHQHLNSEEKSYITIEHLLTMTSGLAWNEWGAAHGTSANDIDRLYFDCEDPISCVLERPMVAPPGQDFTYNGGGTIILGEILKNASGLNLDEFSMKYLFGPLNVDYTLWTQFENGVIDGGGSLRLTPREMLKFGVTYLNGGEWDSESIIPSEWVEKSALAFNNNIGINIPIEDTGKNGYAYSWWTSELSHSGEKTKCFRAGGWGGQSIMVFPELDMVIVFTGGNYAVRSSLHKIVERFILPAI